MTVSRSLQCRAFISRAVIYKKLLSLLFPVGGVGGGQWIQMAGA